MPDQSIHTKLIQREASSVKVTSSCRSCFVWGLAVIGTTISGCGPTPKKSSETPADAYQRALAQAYVRNDSLAILNARYNLAVCLILLQQYPQALKMIDHGPEIG